MSKIKVLRVIARMNVGGPAFLVKDLMGQLDESRFDQVLVYGSCQGQENEIPQMDKLQKAKKLPMLGRKINLFRDLISLYQIIKIIRIEKPQIIDTHTFKAGLLVRGYFLFLPYSQIKLVHHYHGHLLDGYFSNRLAYLYRLVEKTLSRTADILITDGSLISDALFKNGIAQKDKFLAVRPGIDTQQIDSYEWRIQNIFQKHARTPIIAFIGRLAPIKRPDRFLQVVTELKSRGVACDFQIYGEGELYSDIAAEISKLKLPLQIQPFQNDIFEILKNVDLLVMTSDNEGTPLTVMQASLAGVPCVGTDVGSMREIIQDGINGYLVKADYLSLAAKIQELISNRHSLQTLQKSSANFAELNFSIVNYVKAHERIYSDLAKSLNS